MTAVFVTSPAGAGGGGRRGGIRMDFFNTVLSPELNTGATSFVTATVATLGTIISIRSGFAFFSLLSL